MRYRVSRLEALDGRLVRLQALNARFHGVWKAQGPKVVVLTPSSCPHPSLSAGPDRVEDSHRQGSCFSFIPVAYESKEVVDMDETSFDELPKCVAGRLNVTVCDSHQMPKDPAANV